MKNRFFSRPACLGALLPILATLTPSPAVACGGSGTDSIVATVCITAANFCPRGTIEAYGQILSIAQNSALFALLGTTYGGDGQTTFGLPDLRGRVPVGDGQGPGLSPVVLGQAWGTESVTLTNAQLPAHTHAVITDLQANTTAGTDALPSAGKNALAGVAAQELTGSGVVTASTWGAPAGVGSTTPVAGLTATVMPTGSNQPFAIQPPSLGLRYCIVRDGIYPLRN